MNEPNSAVIVGGGVIGQVYAGRLAATGIDVTIVARGEAIRTLRENGVALIRRDERTVVRCRVIDSADPDALVKTIEAPADVAFVAVRADQLGSALATAQKIPARTLVTMANLAGDPRSLLAATEPGSDVVLAFPGIGGERTSSGIRYHEIAQQKTTVGTTPNGSHAPVVAMLRRAGFVVDVVDDMPSWLATHAVFITGVGAYVLYSDAAGVELGRERSAVAEMVRAISEGFRALRKSLITVTPFSLNMIFTIVPGFFSVPYWQRMLRSDVGRLSIAPHIRATRTTEFPAIAAHVRSIVGDDAPTLTCLMRKAGL